MFVKEDAKVRDKLLAKFELDVAVLKQYPQVLKSLFTLCNEPIPQEL